MTDSGVHFDAVLHPHRSLSPKAFLIVMIPTVGDFVTPRLVGDNAAL